MRRAIATAGLLALAGCADDAGGPRVAPDARPASVGPREPAGRRKGKAVTAPATPPSPSKVGTLRP